MEHCCGLRCVNNCLTPRPNCNSIGPSSKGTIFHFRGYLFGGLFYNSLSIRLRNELIVQVNWSNSVKLKGSLFCNVCNINRSVEYLHKLVSAYITLYQDLLWRRAWNNSLLSFRSNRSNARDCFIGLSKHREESYKYDAQRRFLAKFGAWIGDETLYRAFDTSSQLKQLIKTRYLNLLHGGDFLFQFDELLMSLRSSHYSCSKDHLRFVPWPICTLFYD